MSADGLRHPFFFARLRLVFYEKKILRYGKSNQIFEGFVAVGGVSVLAAEDG